MNTTHSLLNGRLLLNYPGQFYVYWMHLFT